MMRRNRASIRRRWFSPPTEARGYIVVLALWLGIVLPARIRVEVTGR